MNRREFISASALATLGCIMPGVASSSDPFILPELPGYPPGWQAYGGRTQVAPLPIGANTAVIMLFGDSTPSNVVNSLYTPAQSLNQNFNVYNGGLYSTAEPLLGCNINSANLSSGSYFSRVADNLRSAGTFSRVVLAPFGVGGSLFADYAAGGAINGRIAAAWKRVQAAGLDTGHVYWYFQCGANDKNAGVSQASATASLNSVISTIRGLSSANIFIPTHSNFGLATSAAIQAAQAAVIDNVSIFTGGNLDSLAGSAANYWDNTHYNATGAAAAATIAANAIAAHV
jgi:hypothetical protein